MDKLDINLLLSNTNLYKWKAQMDFETCSFIFLKFGDFKILFEILRNSSMSIVRKVILYDEIIF